VRDLGVHLDEELTVKQHVAKVAASCFYHLRQNRRRVGTEMTTRFVLAFITSRLDYCNSVLAGRPQVTLEPLQRVQNAAVRLILDLNLWDHVTSGLRQPHWLPLHWRIQYKLCSIMQSIHVGRCPVYMAKCVQIVADNASRSGLRSANSTFYCGYERDSQNGHFHRKIRLIGIHFWLKFVMMPTFLRLEINSKTYFFNLAYSSFVVYILICRRFYSMCVYCALFVSGAI